MNGEKPQATPLATKADVQAVCNAVRRHRDRMAEIEQLFASLPPVSWTLVDAPAPEPCDDWAEALVQSAAFLHASSSCLGYTTWCAGRARCGRCGWTMVARMGEASTAGSARFALAALARVGQAIALAVDELVQALFEAVLP